MKRAVPAAGVLLLLSVVTWWFALSLGTVVAVAPAIVLSGFYGGIGALVVTR